MENGPNFLFENDIRDSVFDTSVNGDNIFESLHQKCHEDPTSGGATYTSTKRQANLTFNHL